MSLHRFVAAVLSAALLPLGAAKAATTVFDFESMAPGGPYAALSQTVGGLTVTISGRFDVIASPPPGLSGNTLLNFSYGGGFYTADFSAAVNGVTIFGSDFQPSDPDTIFLAA